MTAALLCPFWVKSRHHGLKSQCPLYPQKRTLPADNWMSALCQKRTLAGYTVSYPLAKGYVHYQLPLGRMTRNMPLAGCILR